MNEIANTMLGISKPIRAEGETSARGRLIQRMDCASTMHEVQPIIRYMQLNGILVLNDGVLELDIEKARERVKHLLSMVNSKHPAAMKFSEALGDMVYRLIDKMTAALTGFPTVTTWQPATS